MPHKGNLAERFLARVVIDAATGCHIFTGALNGVGYGVIGRGARGEGNVYTHRLAYELHVGPIPDGLHIDHLCRNRACCNPEHLEPVTQAENNRRAVAVRPPKTHCKWGHEFTTENTIQTPRQRHCRACRRARDKRTAA